MFLRNSGTRPRAGIFLQQQQNTLTSIQCALHDFSGYCWISGFIALYEHLLHEIERLIVIKIFNQLTVIKYEIIQVN